MERTNAEWAERQTVEGPLRNRSFELWYLQTSRGPPGQQRQHRTPLEPPPRERERGSRCCVEPLQIINRDQKRPALSQHLQHISNRDPECTRIHGVQVLN